MVIVNCTKRLKGIMDYIGTNELRLNLLLRLFNTNIDFGKFTLDGEGFISDACAQIENDNYLLIIDGPHKDIFKHIEVALEYIKSNNLNKKVLGIKICKDIDSTFSKEEINKSNLSKDIKDSYLGYSTIKRIYDLFGLSLE